MQALRTPDTGCPWDLQQDFSSIAPYTLEEAYEVVDAIERAEMDDLRDELGDLLLQVVYHAQMAKEADHFEFADVVEAISTKMVRRHPHVFGDAATRTAGVETGFWERAKDAERKGTAKQRERVLDDIPAALPALTRALKLQKRAARVGFDWPDISQVVDKVVEEAQELTEARNSLPAEKQAEEFGDLLFVIVNLGRHMGLDAEDALRKANSKFTRRFSYVEDTLEARGSSVEEADLNEMDMIWNEIRRRDNGAA
ncbi:MAG: nucleoside triphosphate pyrophosphohydrolase [Pseudomonadota bacterium]